MVINHLLTGMILQVGVEKCSDPTAPCAIRERQFLNQICTCLHEVATVRGRAPKKIAFIKIRFKWVLPLTVAISRFVMWFLCGVLFSRSSFIPQTLFGSDYFTTPKKNNMLNPKSWRFGSDVFPVPKDVILRFRVLVFWGLY